MSASNPSPCHCGCQSVKPSSRETSAARANSLFVPAPTVHAQIVHEVLNSPGLPLPSRLKGWLEPQFHANLDHVRIHLDDRAFEAAWEIHALAFTYSNHIVFGKAHFAPHTWTGLRLLGHELAHVLQQTEPGLQDRPDDSSVHLRCKQLGCQGDSQDGRTPAVQRCALQPATQFRENLWRCGKRGIDYRSAALGAQRNAANANGLQLHRRDLRYRRELRIRGGWFSCDDDLHQCHARG